MPQVFANLASLPLGLILAALAAAVWFGLAHAGREAAGWRAAGVKTASTALLALAAWVAGGPGWVVAGLGLGAVGDFALARPGKGAFLAGMAAFALGHLAYAAGFAAAWSAAGGGWPALVLPVAAAMAVLVALTALVISPRAGGLAWPVRAYALVIAAMVVAASALPDLPGRGAIQTGVALFTVSDLILALRLFVLRGPAVKLGAARLLWPLYWVGQALILWGALA